MRLTLFVEESQKIQDFISINLQTWVGTAVNSQKSAKFAIEYLEENHSSVSLIITKAKNSTEKSGQAIYKYLQENNISIPLIIIGADKDIPEAACPQLESALNIKPILQNSAKALGVTAKDMAALAVPEFFAIPINYFLHIKQSVTNIYEKTEEEFTEVFTAYTDFEDNAVAKKITERVSKLYIKSSDRLKFVTNITQELASKLTLNDLNEDEQVTASEMTNKLLQEKLARVGVTKETVQLAQKNMKYMMQSSKSFSTLSKLLKRLTKNKSGYLFKHSQLLICVCSHLMDNIDWGNDDQKKKMVFISFFHDIALATDAQAMIYSELDLKESSLNDKERDLVNRHAQIAAELIHKYPKAPMGADIIIRQHHGITHGVGFSEHYSGNLSPMTIVFILAEDYVDSIIKMDKNFDPKAKVTQMRGKYPTQRFQKIIDVLESLVF